HIYPLSLHDALPILGLAGEDEADAFQSLPAAPHRLTEALIEEVRDRLVPAAATEHFDRFAESVHGYGRLSGQCFAARQGGPYNGDRKSTRLNSSHVA